MTGPRANGELLEVFCWCQLERSRIPAQDVLDGRTYSCGLSSCRPNGRSHAELADVLDALRATRFLWASEDDLQRGLLEVFEQSGLPVAREFNLGREGRIDFLVGTVGVEVKVAGTWQNVRRQIAGYLQHATLSAMVVVTSKARHDRLPAELVGKPVVVHRVAHTL